MGFKVAFAWIQRELFLVSNIPIESNRFVSTVVELEGHCFWLADYAIADDQLIIWKTFESNTL